MNYGVFKTLTNELITVPQINIYPFVQCQPMILHPDTVNMHPKLIEQDFNKSILQTQNDAFI